MYTKKIGLIELESPKFRIAFSFVTNLAKTGIGFIAAIIIARKLGVYKYGEYGFLVTSFGSIAYLIDGGASNAFYSKISRHTKGKSFYIIYMLWISVQFVLTSLILMALCPAELLNALLYSDDRLTLYLSFCAVFVQQQIINALTMVLESDRKTLKSQTIMLLGSLYYLATIVIYSYLASLTLDVVFAIMISQQLIVGLLLYRSVRKIVSQSADESDKWKKSWSEYINYCTPLIPSVVFSFVHNYSDRWLLQRFAGSIEQGYFHISTQLSLITIIITTSLLRVFTKEIASALGSGDRARMERIYRDAYSSSILVISIISGMIIPWSGEILIFTLGNQYTGASQILMLLLIYPIYQSLGQIGGTFLMSTGQTALQSLISVSTITISLTLSFFALAPDSLHGFNLGGFGLALKMCLVSIISVNILNYAIAKSNGFKIDVMHQAFIPIFLSGGFIFKSIVGRLLDADVHTPALMVLSVGLMTVLYFLFTLLICSALSKREMAPTWLREVFHK